MNLDFSVFEAAQIIHFS